jgi:hypothetical protein
MKQLICLRAAAFLPLARVMMKILWLLVINLGITSAGCRLNRVSSFPSGLGFCGIWLPLELWRGHAVLVAWLATLEAFWLMSKHTANFTEEKKGC